MPVFSASLGPLGQRSGLILWVFVMSVMWIMGLKLLVVIKQTTLSDKENDTHPKTKFAQNKVWALVENF